MMHLSLNCNSDDLEDCMEKTLVILKPDTIRRKLVGEMILRLERKNLHIEDARYLKISRETAEEHYQHVSHLPFFSRILDYMTSGPSIVLVLSGENAISIVRNMLGKANALESPPGSIRGDFGICAAENLIHASDSPENVSIEIARFFSK
jgi:nucleoside-diphosphate kinase